MGSAHQPKSTRARKAHPLKKNRRKPANKPSPEAMRARLAERQPADTDSAAVDTLREMRDGVPVTELYGIRHKLKLAQSCVRVVEVALRDQNCELDSNAADILSAHVTDAMHIQIMKIDRLLGRDVDKDDIEENDL